MPTRTLLVLFLMVPSTVVADLSFEMNLLPSQEGATYGGSAPENTVYSIIAGLLRQNTGPGGATATGFYQVPGLFDHTIDASLEWSIQVMSSGQATPQILLEGLTDAWNFIIRSDGL
jgi:hypothetical protein